MSNNRWYDHDVTLSMAVSLLQNTPDWVRLEVTRTMNCYLARCHPELFESNSRPATVLPFLQRRAAMDTSAWSMVERLRPLNELDRNQAALEIIRMVYCLENSSTLDMDYISTNTLHAEAHSA